MAEMQVIIHNKEQDKYYWPAVQDNASLELTRKGLPGKFSFKVLKDDMINFAEGDSVQVSYGGIRIFHGYVFTKKRNKDNAIAVTAYDQLRYLKNKDIYTFINVKASDAIKEIAEDFELQIGEIADTEYVIPRHRGSNECLFDIIQTLLDKTMESMEKIYVLYDDCGKLMLKEISDMALNILIDAETAENFSYESSIDKDTYNRIKLYYDDKEDGKRKGFVLPNETNIRRWGVLQYTENINPQKAINYEEKARVLLRLHNRVKRTLSVQNAAGDIRVRAGSMLYVNLHLGDMQVADQLFVENVKHKFSNQSHLMDLTLRGGAITG